MLLHNVPHDILGVIFDQCETIYLYNSSLCIRTMLDSRSKLLTTDEDIERAGLHGDFASILRSRSTLKSSQDKLLLYNLALSHHIKTSVYLYPKVSMSAYIGGLKGCNYIRL